MTVDYDGEQAAPEPASAVVAQFLRRSISIAEITRGALRGWLFGVIGLVMGAVFGVYSIWATPPTYSVTIGLLPTDASGDSGLGEGGLASLAGLLGVGGGNIPKFTRFVTSLNATAVAKVMDQKYDMICKTYRGPCDPKTHKWTRRRGWQADFDRLVAQIAHLPDPDAPRTAADLANYTGGAVTITPDPKTHILTLAMDSREPQTAVHYLTVLVQATNDFIKEQDRSTIQPYVDYLHKKLAATDLNLTQREAFNSLLIEQERKLMLSSVNTPYAAAIQDGPNVTISNKALRMLAVDMVLGLIIGMAAGFFWTLRAKGRQTRSQLWTRY